MNVSKVQTGASFHLIHRRCLGLLTLAATALGFQPNAAPLRLGEFPQEIRTEFGLSQGLPSLDVRAVAVVGGSNVFAATSVGLARFDGERWHTVAEAGTASISVLAVAGDRLHFVNEPGIHRWQNGQVTLLAPVPAGVEVRDLAVADQLIAATDQGLFRLVDGQLRPVAALNDLLGLDRAVHRLAAGPGLAVGAAAGLFERTSEGLWKRLLPADGQGRSWAPTEVRGLAYDPSGSLWFASPQGVGMRSARQERLPSAAQPSSADLPRAASGLWTLYTGSEGLPWNEFTSLAAGPEGVWFGTTRGAIRFADGDFAYRQGRRWVPDDQVRGVTLTADGAVWLATGKGVGRIERRMLTLADKANFYERQIDMVHRRTPWQYVLEVSVAVPGETNRFARHDSDNDGLWTSMYGAAECFAYAATRSPLAQRRARQAFEALHWLGEVTQGGQHSPPPGYVARTVLPTSGPDPNAGRRERDEAHRKDRDALWKVYEPRWPKSRDGQWYWKSDTSSDELDGHFFFYGLYHDLVASTSEEKVRVREQTRRLMDHLIDHDFQLIDHDGKPTRWGIFNPAVLNRDPLWADERGLNSLSLLSYLATTGHLTGDPKYEQLIERLCAEEHYDANLRVPKIQRGIGSGNHSDDEMAFMCFYNLTRYAKNDRLRQQAGYAWFSYWLLEQPEMNPFFNFAYAAFGLDFTYRNAWGTFHLPPWPGWLEDAVDTLKRFPLDRFDWRHDNLHRLDVIRLPRQIYDPYETDFRPMGYRVNGKVIPVDERFFEHWNHNPFELATGGSGHTLATGAVFLLPYYMGLYHGCIADEGLDRLDR
jgi:hypothetical protein